MATPQEPIELQEPVTEELTSNLNPFELMSESSYLLKYTLCMLEPDLENPPFFFFQMTDHTSPEGECDM
jgi:hypothetical protein